MPPSWISSRAWYWPLPRPATRIGGIGADQEHIPKRQPDVPHRLRGPGARVTGEGRALDVGLVLTLHDVVDHRAARQLGQQHGQEVIVDGRGVGPAELVQLHRPGSPQRDLLQTHQVGAGRGDLGGHQPAADGEVGTVDDLSQLVVGLGQGQQGFGSGTAGRGAYRPVDVGPEVEVAGHHGNRVGVVRAEPRQRHRSDRLRPATRTAASQIQVRLCFSNRLSRLR